MQTVSQAWKDAHKKTILNESYVEVSLDIADPDALVDATSSDNGSVYISDTQEVVSTADKPTISFGTLEQNIWLLDGTRQPIPEYSQGKNIDGGYVGDVLSDEEGRFMDKIPTITINFTEIHTQPIPGLIITWGDAYDEYAEHFVVTAYNGNTVVAKKEVFDNDSVMSVLTWDISNYNKIIIQIFSWCLPNHRARVNEIFMGWHSLYSKTELLSYSHEQVVDPISTSLPKMEIKFSIDNRDGTYNPYNLQGLAKYLTERQEVKARYGLKLDNGRIEWIDGGTFYLSEWYAKQNGISADFVARDLLEFMSAPYNDKVTEIKERTLYDLADTLLKAANLSVNSNGSVRWVIDDSLKSIKTKAPLPYDTIANNLQMIANMGRCVLYPDRKGRLHITPITTQNTDYKISSFNSFSKSEMTLSKPIKEVVVKVYDYTIGEKGAESTITERTTKIGDTGETITVDNPLVTGDSLADTLGEWIGNYLKNRMTLKSSMRADVRLDALDIVSNENEYNTNTVRTTNVNFEFNGSFRGTSEGRVI